MKLNALLITGTDTDAGKTVLTTALAAYWQTYHRDRTLGIMKPIQSGTGDRELYQRLFTLEQLPEEITPLYFQTPVAPPIAADREGRLVELEVVWPIFQKLCQRCSLVLVEALGGLGSPVTHEITVADVARDWRLPTVLVVPVKLGAIAQAVANVALAKSCHVDLKGIVLNCVQHRSEEEIADWSPINLIESLTNVPVLGILPHFNDPFNLEQLAKAAANLNLEPLILSKKAFYKL